MKKEKIFSLINALSTPRKAGLLLDLITGKSVKDALLTLEFNDKVDQIRACNHLGSKLINKIEIESEASADIYMSRYFKRFMNSDKAQTHFCHYKAPTNYQEANYLHPYHRQALISCF